jgi:hypothetical protein
VQHWEQTCAEMGFVVLVNLAVITLVGTMMIPYFKIIANEAKI